MESQTSPIIELSDEETEKMESLLEQVLVHLGFQKHIGERVLLTKVREAEKLETNQPTLF